MAPWMPRYFRCLAPTARDSQATTYTRTLRMAPENCLAPFGRRLCRRNRLLGEAGRSTAKPCDDRRRGPSRPPPKSKLPVLIPRRVGADALARDGDVEQVRAVLLRHALEPAAQRGLELLHLGDLLAVHALRAREPDVVDHRRAERETRILAVAHHLAVGHLVGPVMANDLVALVVRDDDQHRGAVAGHRPEADRAIAQRAVAEVADDRPLAADGDLGADRRADAEAERAAAAARPRHAAVAEMHQRRTRRRRLLNHHRLARQGIGQVRLEDGRMNHRVALVLARQLLLALDQRLRVRGDLVAPLRPAADALGAVQPRQRLDDRLQRALHLALRGEIERIVTAHEYGVRADLDHARLVHAAVHALTADEQKQIGLQARHLHEVL